LGGKARLTTSLPSPWGYENGVSVLSRQQMRLDRSYLPTYLLTSFVVSGRGGKSLSRKEDEFLPAVGAGKSPNGIPPATVNWQAGKALFLIFFILKFIVNIPPDIVRI